MVGVDVRNTKRVGDTGRAILQALCNTYGCQTRD
jgi:hypothetical protein